MASWFPYLLGSVGLTVVIVLSHIARPIRYWGCLAFDAIGLDLPCPLYCSLCTGTWIGFVAGATHLVTTHGLAVVVAAPGRCLLDTLAMAFGTAVVSYVTTTWLESKGHFTKPQHDRKHYEHNH